MYVCERDRRSFLAVAFQSSGKGIGVGFLEVVGYCGKRYYRAFTNQVLSP